MEKKYLVGYRFGREYIRFDDIKDFSEEVDEDDLLHLTFTDKDDTYHYVGTVDKGLYEVDDKAPAITSYKLMGRRTARKHNLVDTENEMEVIPNTEPEEEVEEDFVEVTSICEKCGNNPCTCNQLTEDISLKDAVIDSYNYFQGLGKDEITDEMIASDIIDNYDGFEYKPKSSNDALEWTNYFNKMCSEVRQELNRLDYEYKQVEESLQEDVSDNDEDFDELEEVDVDELGKDILTTLNEKFTDKKKIQKFSDIEYEYEDSEVISFTAYVDLGADTALEIIRDMNIDDWEDVDFDGESYYRTGGTTVTDIDIDAEALRRLLSKMNGTEVSGYKLDFSNSDGEEYIADEFDATIESEEPSAYDPGYSEYHASGTLSVKICIDAYKPEELQEGRYSAFH